MHNSAITDADEAGKKRAAEAAAKLRTDGKIARQVILLAALYARTDQATLGKVRKMLSPWSWLADAMPGQLSAPTALLAVGGVALSVVTGTAAANALNAEPRSSTAHVQPSASSSSKPETRLQTAYTTVAEKPVACIAGAFGLSAVSVGVYMRQRHARSLRRAEKLQNNIRVVKRRPVDDVASVLDLFATGRDDVETVRCATLAMR